MKVMSSFPVYKRYSERSILIEFEQKIDPNVLKQVLSYKKSIQNHHIKEILELITTYNSIIVIYRYTIEDFYSEVERLKSTYVNDLKEVMIGNRIWEIPVCYDESLVSDLSLFAAKKSLSVPEVIQLHTRPVYTIYFIGFLPGFLYLGGLDTRLEIPRKNTPDKIVSKGSVAIGGNQTGLYPLDSPGGWYAIGKTPITFFDVNKKDLCLFTAGDSVKFVAVSKKKYNDISFLVDRGVYVLNTIDK